MKKQILTTTLLSLLITTPSMAKDAVVGFPMVKTITNETNPKPLNPNGETLTDSIKKAQDAKKSLKEEETKITTDEVSVKKEANPYEKYKEEESSFSIDGFQLGVGIGALGGVNAQIGYRIPQSSKNFWKNRFGFRFDYNTWTPLENQINKFMEDNPIEIDGNKLTAIIEGKQFGGLIDFYPFGNTWGLGNIRISGGYYTGDFSIGASLNKNANESFTMKDEEGHEIQYTVDGNATLTALMDYDVTGPYAGIGFDFALFWGLKFYVDAGLVFTDKPNIITDINGKGNLEICYDSSCETHPINTDNEEIQQLLNDTKREYEKELDELRKGYFPMAKIGILFRF